MMIDGISERANREPMTLSDGRQVWIRAEWDGGLYAVRVYAELRGPQVLWFRGSSLTAESPESNRDCLDSLICDGMDLLPPA